MMNYDLMIEYASGNLVEASATQYDRLLWDEALELGEDYWSRVTKVLIFDNWQRVHDMPGGNFEIRISGSPDEEMEGWLLLAGTDPRIVR